MPFQNPTQSSRDQQVSDHNVEIITPLEVSTRKGQSDPSRRRSAVKTVLLLIMALAAIASGGLVFIRYVSENSLNLTEDRAKAVPSKADIRTKQPPDAALVTGKSVDTGTAPASVPVEQGETQPEQQIDPESIALQKQRAEKLDDVKRLIESGRNHEKNNRLAFSLADYHQALNMDPESGPAREGLRRVKERIAGVQFQKLMSDGLAAYHSGNYQDARAKLLKAKSFQSGSSEVREALVMIEEAIRLDSIEILRKAAAGAEQRENWEQALKSYKAVLEIDPNISFAVQGKERSLEQIRIARRMAFFFTKPDAMESNQQLQNAISLVETAERLQPRGPQFDARLDKLKGLVNAAQTPVRVVITSDNFTEVAVYRVGKLGRFVVHELSLRPGTYTLVGSRDGYRDTRVAMRVKPGQESLGVTVICRDEVY